MATIARRDGALQDGKRRSVGPVADRVQDIIGFGAPKKAWHG